MSDGYGRGTKYRLKSGANIDNVASNKDNVDSLDPNVDSSKESINWVLEELGLSEESRALLKRKRLSQSQMEILIGEIASNWRTIQDFVRILGKDKSYLRNHVLPSLVSKGILEKEYASIPNHPNQRYRIKQG